MDSRSNLIVDGYMFGSIKDAETANEELQKIRYLENNANYQNPRKMQMLYDKIIDGKMFQTPIGWNYLLLLRKRLIQLGIEEETIRPVPLYTIFAHEEVSEMSRVRTRVQPTVKRKVPYRGRFVTSVCVNIILAVAVIGMFVITLKSDNPNILNYKNVITNSYAAWDEELTEREKVIRQKEKELGINSPIDTQIKFPEDGTEE